MFLLLVNFAKIMSTMLNGKFGSRVVVIFDGYENKENSTKAHEHRLRSSKHISREIQAKTNSLQIL